MSHAERLLFSPWAIEKRSQVNQVQRVSLLLANYSGSFFISARFALSSAARFRPSAILRLISCARTTGGAELFCPSRLNRLYSSAKVPDLSDRQVKRRRHSRSEPRGRSTLGSTTKPPIWAQKLNDTAVRLRNTKSSQRTN